MLIRPSGRSSDFIAPSFGYGCLLNCTYCYMKRHKPEGLDVSKNIGSILTEISNHAWFTEVEKPNQTDPEYITYDIACNEDFALHRKYYDWEQIFEVFVKHPHAKATFATKIIPHEFLSFNPKGKVRIRFSLMPQVIADQLEPNTPPIQKRIEAINDFKRAGYDVHINFSPVVVFDGWLNEYKELFKLVDSIVEKEYKTDVLSEVIFLTHNEDKHKHNVENNLPGENLLWNPTLQQPKISQYGGHNLRYRCNIKDKYIRSFKMLHNEIIPWNQIRYIF
jgi:spore photoproduct lyase